jgi:hypothetical protein
MDFVSWDADGYTLDQDTASAGAYLISSLVFGQSGVSHSITGAVTATTTIAATMTFATAPALFRAHPALAVGGRQRRPAALFSRF